MAQTTVFEETFSTEQWISRPNGTSGIWHLEGISGSGSPMAFGSTIAGDGTNEDSAYYAYYKNEFQLVSNRTYRISVRCSLATNAGTKEVVLGLGPDLDHARRSTAQVVLQTGALTTNGWNTFTATFNTTGNLANWTEAVPVLWANVLGTPQTAMVYVDDIKIEQLSNLPPETVAILTPASWAIVNSPANIRVTATDPDNNIERIKFYSGTTYLGEVLSASNIVTTTQTSYNFSTNLAPGTRSVKAVAIDQYGLSLESATRTFVINTPPVAISTSPANGTQYTSSGSVLLSALASDEDFNLTKVEFYVNGQKVGEDNSAPYTYSYSNTAGGHFTWYARAVDDRSLWGLSEERNFDISSPYTTSIISPQDRGTVGSCNVYLQAETTYGPGGILAMNFFRNDTLIGTDSISPYEYKGTGWAAGEYSIEARGVDLQGIDIAGAQIVLNVESAEVVLNLSETNEGCSYKISGTLAPNQSLTLSGLPNALYGDGNPFTGMELVTGKDEQYWRKFLVFTDFEPVGLGYTLTNAYGCSITGTFTLHPEANEAPAIESDVVIVSGLKLDPNTGEYYYCEPDVGNLVIQPVVANTTGTVWYQALNPADLSQVYQTFTDGTVPITSPMLEEQQLILNAITPLGCTGGKKLTIDFSGRQAPVVTVAPVTVYGTEPALAVAQASGGTGTYSYTWSTGTCLDSSRCDSVMLANFANPVTVSVVDGNGCGNSMIVPTEPAPPALVTIPPHLFQFSILAHDSLITDTTLGTDGKIGYTFKGGNGLITIPLDSIVDSVSNQVHVFTQVANFKTQVGNLTPTCTNCPLSTTISPGVRNITGNYTLASVLELEGHWNDQFIWNIAGDLILEGGAEIKYSNNSPAHIIWNVSGDVVVHDGAKLKGTVLADGKISIKTNAIEYSRLISNSNIDIDPVGNLPVVLFSTNNPGAEVILVVDGPNCDNVEPNNFVLNHSFECGGITFESPGGGESQPRTFFKPCDKNVDHWFPDRNLGFSYYKDAFFNPDPPVVGVDYVRCNTLPVKEMQIQLPIYQRGFGNPDRAFIGLSLYSTQSNAPNNVQSLQYFIQQLNQPLGRGPYIGRFRIACHSDSRIGVKQTRRIGMFISQLRPMRKTEFPKLYPTNPSSNISNLSHCDADWFNSLVYPNTFATVAECPFDPITPQVMVTNDNQLKTTQWSTIENVFELQGSERFITLGAFADYRMYLSNSGGPLLDGEQFVNGHHSGDLEIEKMQWQYVFDAVELIALPRAGVDYVICQGQTVTLGEFTNNPDVVVSSFLWSTGQTTPTISVSPTRTTTYTMTIVFNGQTYSTSSTVTVLPPRTYTNLPLELNVCQNESLTLDPAWVNNEPGTWFIVSNGVFVPVTSPVQTSTLTLEVGLNRIFFKSSNGCDFEEFDFNYKPNPSITVTANPSPVCQNQETIYTATLDPTATYCWYELNPGNDEPLVCGLGQLGFNTTSNIGTFTGTGGFFTSGRLLQVVSAENCTTWVSTTVPIYKQHFTTPMHVSHQVGSGTVVDNGANSFTISNVDCLTPITISCSFPGQTLEIIPQYQIIDVNSNQVVFGPAASPLVMTGLFRPTNHYRIEALQPNGNPCDRPTRVFTVEVNSAACLGSLASECSDNQKINLIHPNPNHGAISNIQWIAVGSETVLQSGGFQFTLPNLNQNTYRVQFTFQGFLMDNTFSVFNDATFNGGLLSGINFLYGSTTMQGTVTLPLDGYTENIGELLVAQNAVFNLDGKLVNGNSSSIFCGTNSRLNLSSTGTLQGRNCNEFWSGVTVSNGAWFKALSGSHINHMRNGIRVGTGSPTPKITVTGSIMDENYICFQFDHPVRGSITSCTTQYRGNLEIPNYTSRSIPELDAFNDEYGTVSGFQNQGEQKGYSFVSIRSPIDLIGQDEENIFFIRQNRINRYLTGISTRFQASETGSLKMEIQGNTFLGCNRSLNLMGKGVYNILDNTVDPRSNFSENYLIQEHFYAALTSASDLDKIGYIEPSASTAMNMVQPKYIGVNVMGSGSQLNVAGNSFFGAGLSTPRYIENGIFVDALNCQFKFQQNNFNKLRTAIQFYSGMHTIDKMECNTFDNGEGALVNTYAPRIGLLFGGRTETDPLNPSLPALQEDLGTAGLTGPIGNSGFGFPFPLDNPSGNAWPVDPDDLVQFPVSDGISVLQHWKSPLNWVSLQNNNPGFNLEYWAYNNEFVGSTPLVNTDVLTRPTPGEQIMMYRTGTLNPPVSVPGEVVYIPQCNNDLPNVYPLRMAVEQNINSFTSIQRSENYAVQNAHLGEAFPNPATSQVTFQVFIPEQSDKDYQLSIFDLNGKKVLSQITIMVKGAANVEMPLLSLQAGVYGYSLSENGRTLGTRKLVIIKKL